MRTINGSPFYLDKFLIALYKSDYLMGERCVLVVDNPRELCEQMGIDPTENNLSKIRAKLRRSRNNDTLFNYCGVRCKVYLIRIDSVKKKT